MIPAFVPGRSVVHRTPASVKLLVLLAAGAGSFLLDTPGEAATALAAVLALHAVARLPLRAALAGLRPVLVVAAVVGAVHVVASGWERAAVVVGVLTALVLAAGLVTLTTRTTDVVDAIVAGLRPARRLGADPERAGLLLALAIRSVPVVVGLAEEVRDAQRARGLTASPRAFGVPLLVRALRHADDLGEALVARGADDD